MPESHAPTEAQRFFANRDAATRGKGAQPYAKPWLPTLTVGNNHLLHYITYAFAAPFRSPAYELFARTEARLNAAGIRAEEARWVHASAFSISRQAHFPTSATKASMIDTDGTTASRISKQAEHYCKQAKPFSLELTGRLMLLPNTITYEVADFEPYNEFLRGLWNAVPEFENLAVHPKNPNLSPVDHRDGAAALFQAAYETSVTGFKNVRAVVDAINAEAKPVTFEAKNISRMLHTLSVDRDGVSVPVDPSVGVPEGTAVHWNALTIGRVTLGHGMARDLG